MNYYKKSLQCLLDEIVAGSGPVREHGTKPVPVKQEPSGKS